MRRTLLALSYAVALFSSSTAWAFSTGSPEEVGISSQRLQRIGEVFRQEIEKGQFPGAVSWSREMASSSTAVATRSCGRISPG